MAEQLTLFVDAPRQPGHRMTLAEWMADLYESRTEADFDHMAQRLADAAARQEPRSNGSDLAELLLTLRAMKHSESTP